MNENLFYKYIKDVMIPYIKDVRQIKNIMLEKAVLMMDSASSHCSERILKKLAKHNILALTYPSHTSNLFQALDLVFFGVLKKNKSRIYLDSEENFFTNQLLEIIEAYETTSTSRTIRSSFKKAGIIHSCEGDPERVVIDENEVRNNRGFQEIWNQNIPIEAISARRRQHDFGVINKRFLVGEKK